MYHDFEKLDKAFGMARIGKITFCVEWYCGTSSNITSWALVEWVANNSLILPFPIKQVSTIVHIRNFTHSQSPIFAPKSARPVHSFFGPNGWKENRSLTVFQMVGTCLVCGSHEVKYRFPCCRESDLDQWITQDCSPCPKRNKQLGYDVLKGAWISRAYDGDKP